MEEQRIYDKKDTNKNIIIIIKITVTHRHVIMSYFYMALT